MKNVFALLLFVFLFSFNSNAKKCIKYRCSDQNVPGGHWCVTPILNGDCIDYTPVGDEVCIQLAPVPKSGNGYDFYDYGGYSVSVFDNGGVYVLHEERYTLLFNINDYYPEAFGWDISVTSFADNVFEFELFEIGSIDEETFEAETINQQTVYAELPTLKHFTLSPNPVTTSYVEVYDDGEPAEEGTMTIDIYDDQFNWKKTCSEIDTEGYAFDTGELSNGNFYYLITYNELPYAVGLFIINR